MDFPLKCSLDSSAKVWVGCMGVSSNSYSNFVDVFLC